MIIMQNKHISKTCTMYMHNILSEEAYKIESEALRR
jgi:hypothetical protein